MDRNPANVRNCLCGRHAGPSQVSRWTVPAARCSATGTWTGCSAGRRLVRQACFERPWMARDLRRRAGMPVERWIEAPERLGEPLSSAADGEFLVDVPPLSAHW